jgi:hypothetical protein
MSIVVNNFVQSIVIYVVDCISVSGILMENYFCIHLISFLQVFPLLLLLSLTEIM